MPMQEHKYLSVKEAMDATGVSDVSIRRLCRRGTKYLDYTYRDKKLIILDSFLYKYYKPIHLPKQDDALPKQDEEMPKQMLKQPSQIPKQDEDLPKQDPNQHSSTNGVDGILPKEYYQNLLAAKDHTIQVISQQMEAKEHQIQVKDEQLQQKDQQINQLIERTREQNIIIQSIQARQLPQATESDKSDKKIKRNITEPLLISVALLSAIALIGFIGLMIYAYLNR
jgi:hypothetical protein